MIDVRKFFWGYFLFRFKLLAWMVTTFIISLTIWVVMARLGIKHEIVGWISVLIGGGIAARLVLGAREPEQEPEVIAYCYKCGSPLGVDEEEQYVCPVCDS